jgi:hypothetical protein
MTITSAAQSKNLLHAGSISRPIQAEPGLGGEQNHETHEVGEGFSLGLTGLKAGFACLQTPGIPDQK